MHPILFTIGPVKVYTYGLLISLGFIIASTVAAGRAGKEGLDPEPVMDLAFYSLIAAIVGSRLLYAVVNYRYFLADPLRIFKLWEGGLVFYGGLIGAVGVGVWYVRKQQLPVWLTLDVFAPSIALGQGIGRLGCFAAGCCYGRKCDLPWAVTFTNQKGLAPLGIPLHPTQLYASFNLIMIFSFLSWFRKRRSFEGQIFALYLIIYSIHRFIIEFFRSDHRGTVFMLSTSQFISLFIISLGIWAYLAKSIKSN
ncbi:MAG: prolipoprotein diacylglyceryl transferase [bacterium]